MKEKAKILAIFNKYKDSFENLVDSLDIKLSYMARQVGNWVPNVIPGFEDFLI